MKEPQILFNGKMVRAILADIKSQTRRVIKPQPTIDVPGKTKTELKNGVLTQWGLGGTIKNQIKCRYGFPGDRPWVRETWRQRVDDGVIYYEADGSIGFDTGSMAHKMGIGAVPCGGRLDEQAIRRAGFGCHKKPSIFMPRWASRMSLLNKDVFVQRIQSITEEDCIAEGIAPSISGYHRKYIEDPIGKFRILWDSINSKPKPVYRKKKITHYISYPWEDINETRQHRGKIWFVIGNPWVWVVAFERLKKEEKYDA